MINYNKVSKFASIRYSLVEFYKKNQIKIWVVSFLILVSLLTGIFTAVKLTDLEKALKYAEFSFEALLEGNIYKFSFFIKRFGSILLVLALLLLFSLNKFIRILGYLLIAYRGFLLSLNITLIIMHLGFAGMVNAIIVILPCQLLELLLMALFFVVAIHAMNDKNYYGRFKGNFVKYLLLILLGTFIVNIVELILLLIFKATTILIIWPNNKIYVY